MNVERLRRAVLALLVVLAVCSSALATDPSLVAHWKFDEGSGSIAYDSADDHDGTVWGGDWTSGILDGALDFDGVDDHLRVADHPTLRFSQYDSFTMSYWAMPAPGEYSSIVGKHRAGGQHGIFGYKSYWSGNSSSFRFTAEESYVGATSITTSADSAPIGNWYHVACVYDNRNMKIYVDGQFISEGTFGYDTGSTTPDHDMVVGARLYDNTMDQYYNGLIDDVRIYDRALTGEEIRQLCREGLGGKASGANPANGAVYVDPQTVLSWEPGEGAVSHDVYFGIDFNDVNDATTSSGEFMDNVDVNSFDPGGLEVGTAYYWRIDEVNGPNTVKGDVWSFTTWVEPNLIAWWTFDEGEGSIGYDSADDHDGRVWGADWTSGILDGALDFDGLDNHVSVPYDPDFQLPVFTVSAWVCLGRDPRPSGSGVIVGRGDDPRSDHQALAFNVGTEGSIWGEGLKLLYEDSGDTERNFATGFFPPVGIWTHVAATRGSNGEVCVYANGGLLDSWASTATPSASCYQDLTIGSHWSNGTMGNFYEGQLDDVRLYNRALAAEEIRQLCREGLGGKAFGGNPANGAVYVDPQTVLSWEPGEGAAWHDVYLGIDFDDVNDADTLSAEFMGNVDVNSFDPRGLELVTTYYWRIDEVNGPNMVKGDIWGFATWVEPNLIAWWKLDEGEGLTAYDSAGNNDGMLTNGPTWTASGINGALSFDDVDDYVEVPDDDYLDISDEITLSAWIRPRNTSVTNDQFIVAKWRIDNSYGMRLEETHPRFFLMAGSSQIAKTYTDLNSAPETWAHMVVTWDGQTMKAYLNGTASDQNEPFSGTINTNDAPIAIGCNLGSAGGIGGAYFDGMIDDVRIYDRALTAEEIEQIYQSASPVNYYYIDGVNGDDLNDGLTLETAFEHIQVGIDAAEDGDTVLVYPDVYVEELDFDGKAITVAGFDEPAVLRAPSFYAVSFFHGEDAN
ncbi:MAG: LamG domain-containing protein, partial [Planctomycetota bacterium]